jgi:hypothetical protein
LVRANQRAGVFSGKQLVWKTWQLWQTKDTASRVLDELKPGQYAAKSPNEAVERVLHFDRSWASFDLPRYLMAVSRIQEFVLGKLGFPAGDYSLFAAQVESYFRAPIIAALDEYGIPLQVAEKIQARLRTADNLDVALQNLKGLDVDQMNLSDFERELVKDAQGAL